MFSKTLFLLLISLTLNANEKMNQETILFELPLGCDFSKVGNNHTMKTDCSPVLKDPYFSEFIGLLINSPKEYIWPKNDSIENYQSLPNGGNNSPLKFTISGLAKIPDSTLDFDGDVSYEILVVAVDQKTAKVYSSKMIKNGRSGTKPISTLNNNNLAHDFIRKHYFNVDLVSNASLPISEAVYTVYAMIGDYKSNVMTVTTKFKND